MQQQQQQQQQQEINRSWITYENAQKIVDLDGEPKFSIVDPRVEPADLGLTSTAETSIVNDETARFFVQNLQQMTTVLATNLTHESSKTLLKEFLQCTLNAFELCWCVMWNRPFLWNLAQHATFSTMLSTDNVVLLAEIALEIDGWDLFEYIIPKCEQALSLKCDWPDALCNACVRRLVADRSTLSRRLHSLYKLSDTLYSTVVDCCALAYLKSDSDAIYDVTPHLSVDASPMAYMRSMKYLFAVGSDCDDGDDNAEKEIGSKSDKGGKVGKRGESAESDSTRTRLSFTDVINWSAIHLTDDRTVWLTFESSRSGIPRIWRLRTIFVQILHQSLTRLERDEEEEDANTRSPWILLEVLLRMNMMEMATDCLRKFNDSYTLLMTDSSAFPQDLGYLSNLLNGMSEGVVSTTFLAKVYAFAANCPTCVEGKVEWCSPVDFVTATRGEAAAGELAMEDFRSELFAVLTDQTNLQLWQPSTIPLVQQSFEINVNHYEHLSDKHKFFSVLRQQSSDTLKTKFGFDETLWNELDGLFKLFCHSIPYRDWKCYDGERHGSVSLASVDKSLIALSPYMQTAATDSQKEAQRMLSAENGITAHPEVVLFVIYVSSGMPALESATRAELLSQYLCNFDINCTGQVWLFLDRDKRQQRRRRRR